MTNCALFGSAGGFRCHWIDWVFDYCINSTFGSQSGMACIRRAGAGRFTTLCPTSSRCMQNSPGFGVDFPVIREISAVANVRVYRWPRPRPVECACPRRQGGDIRRLRRDSLLARPVIPRGRRRCDSCLSSAWAAATRGSALSRPGLKAFEVLCPFGGKFVPSFFPLRTDGRRRGVRGRPGPARVCRRVHGPRGGPRHVTAARASRMPSEGGDKQTGWPQVGRQEPTLQGAARPVSGGRGSSWNTLVDYGASTVHGSCGTVCEIPTRPC